MLFIFKMLQLFFVNGFIIYKNGGILPTKNSKNGLFVPFENVFALGRISCFCFFFKDLQTQLKLIFNSLATNNI